MEQTVVSSGYFFFAKKKVRFPTKLCTAAYPGYFLELGTELGFFYGLEFWTGFGSGLHSGFKITIKDVILNKVNKSKIFQIFRLLQQVLLMNNKEKKIM